MENIDPKKGLISWFARNDVAANLLMILLIIGGLYGAFTIKKQIFPQFEVNVVNIRVPYLGAAPQEVEQGVVLKIEEAIKDLDGIKKLSSTAVEGMATITLEVDDDYAVQDLLDEVKVQVDAIPTLPANTEKPIVYRIKPQQQVLWISAYGDADERTLKEFAKDLRDELANLDGVSNVNVVGARNYEISIEISEQQLQKYNLTFNDVVNAVRGSSIDVPGGSIRSKNGDILLRANGQAYRAYEFAKVVLKQNSDGTKLLLGDIAYINDGFVEDNNYAFFDGKPAVSIQAFAVGNQNALEISAQINEYLAANRDNFPANINADTWGDSSFYLKDRLNMMLKNMASGALLVFIVLALFMRIGLAFWVMVGLPVCFLGTLMFMPIVWDNLSINLLSLFAFILVLGIVVDDAIIMGESAYTTIDEHGHSLDNVVMGVKKVAVPATFGVLTTIAAFSPMMLVTGMFGVFWHTIGGIVILTLIFSLVESKLILPAHLAHMRMKPYDPQQANRLQRFRDVFSEGIKVFIKQRYKPFLEKAIARRYTTLATFFAMLIITIGLFGGGLVRFIFFPDIPSDFVQARIVMEEGSSIEQRDAAMHEIERALVTANKQYANEQDEQFVKHFVSYDQGNLAGVVFIELTKGETRSITDRDIADLWRKQIPEIPGVKTLAIGNPGGPGGGDDLSFSFSGKDIAELRAVSKELKDFLSEYEGVADINDNFANGSDEIRLSLKPQGEVLGITLAQLAQQVRYGFYGAEAQRIQRDDEEIRVMVRYPRAERDSIGNLENMRIRTNQGAEIPFTQVANIDIGQGYSSIIRVDGRRAISVSAKVNKKILEPNRVVGDVMRLFVPRMAQQHPGVKFELQGNSKEQQESMGSLFAGFIFALFLIYMLLAIPLKSYAKPLIIMSVIPFGIVGAILGHLIMGKAVSMLSFLGIIALAGVVVNDSLIMVDFVSRARQQGASLMDAAINAGTQRFRAILLTSLTTFMGLVPIIFFEKSLQAQVVIPMAISLAFGILFATVITLILVPCLYIILADLQQFLKGRQRS